MIKIAKFFKAICNICEEKTFIGQEEITNKSGSESGPLISLIRELELNNWKVVDTMTFCPECKKQTGMSEVKS